MKPRQVAAESRRPVIAGTRATARFNESIWAIQQVGDEGLQARPVLQRARDFGRDAAFDDREDDLMEDPALTVDGIDSREITAADRTGHDRDRFHNGVLRRVALVGRPWAWVVTGNATRRQSASIVS